MLPASTNLIRVVVGIIEQQGRYLITQRRATGKLAGLWEFPNGKVEPQEGDEDAVKREMRERVGVEVRVGRPRTRRTHYYIGYSVELVLYEVTIVPGQQLRPLRVAAFRWVASQELEQYPFPPADQATTDLLLGLA
jgi:8-oxo-dGTP diphosphatase